MRRLLRDIAEGRELGDVTTLRDPADHGAARGEGQGAPGERRRGEAAPRPAPGARSRAWPDRTPRWAASSGQPSSAALGNQTDDLGAHWARAASARRARGPVSATSARDTAIGSWMLVETWVRPSPRSIADRPHAREAATRLAQPRGDLARAVGDVRPGELDVEGGERRAGGDQRRAGRGMKLGGAEVGRSSPPSTRACSSTSPPARKNARSRWL